MNFKVGDWVMWESWHYDIKHYEKILEIHEEKGYYKFLDIKNNEIDIWHLDMLNRYARLMTDEEKVECL